jgi:hypothetical protein
MASSSRYMTIALALRPDPTDGLGVFLTSIKVSR